MLISLIAKSGHSLRVIADPQWCSIIPSVLRRFQFFNPSESLA